MQIENLEEASVVKGNSKVYDALFGGEVAITPRAFNPKNADIFRIKKVDEAGQKHAHFQTEKEYVKKDINGEEIRTVSLLCSFKPNELLNTDKYTDEYYTNININVSNNPIMTSNSGTTKGLIIDSAFNTFYVPGNPLTDNPVECFEKNKQNYPNMEAEFWEKFQLTTLHWAKEGEFQLMTLLRAMLNLPTARFLLGKKDDVADHFANWAKIAKGDVSQLNGFLDKSKTSSKLYFDEKGNQKQIGVFMYAKVDVKSGKIYQHVYNNSFKESFYTPSKQPTKLTNKNGQPYASVKESIKYGVTYMPFDVHAGAFNGKGENEKYNISGFGNTFAFKELDKSMFNVENIETSVESTNTQANQSNAKNGGDDLPF